MPVECGTWAPGKYPGYGSQWNCWAQLALPDSFTVANGCTLMFDPRYDLECKYDYFYVDFWNDSTWVTIGMFNAASNNPGGECGSPGGGNPDYWGNTDSGQPNSANWQVRSNPSRPAFYRVIPPDSLRLESGPVFRWRVVTDGSWSDSDGRGNTDGAAFIDNVWVWGDSMHYEEDFESGTLGPYWSLPDPDGVIDQWHMTHDTDPPYEGGDGGDRTTCTLDSSYAYRARPEGGYPGGAEWRNRWFYRLMTPSIPLENSGCVIQWDEFACWLDYTCDYGVYRVRFHDSEYDQWCPWIGEYNWMCYGGCFFWSFNRQEDVSFYMGPTSDSVQFAWDIVDVSQPGDFCDGKHKKTDYLVDNVSIGLFNADATVFRSRIIDMLQDSFHDSIPGYNSGFDAYDPDTLDYYSGPPYTNSLRYNEQLYVDVSDKDLVRDVRLYGSIDGGQTWTYVTMTKYVSFDPENPDLGGEYYGTFTPEDFYGPGTRWVKGTEIWYYMRCEDQDGTPGNYSYFPAEADPLHPANTNEASDYHTFSVLPMFPGTYTGSKVLLIDGYGRIQYDWSQCLSNLDNSMPLEDIYEQSLTDAGYCYDKYDISGAGSNIHVHPLQYTDYDAIVWFMGPYFSNYLIDKEAQEAIVDYLGSGGKVILCGDRLAYNMADPAEGGVGEDSLGGFFLDGVMGCDYLAEMEGYFLPAGKPYIYLEAEPSVNVFGSPVALDLDSVLVYRECPYLKDMSYVRTIEFPPFGYTAQALLNVLNPSGEYAPCDGAIYTEYDGVGQCVFVNYDLCAFVNHEFEYCSGDAASSAPDFDAGYYDGRVELMRVILEDLFGLPSGGGGHAGGDPTGPAYRWVLAQNAPNPCVSGTEIRYEIARRCHVRLNIYNCMGQVVRVLEDDGKEAGVHHARWDGRNAAGQYVASGVYFYQIDAGRFTATRKMLVLR
jgi:hypothetical protein